MTRGICFRLGNRAMCKSSVLQTPHRCTEPLPQATMFRRRHARAASPRIAAFPRTAFAKIRRPSRTAALWLDRANDDAEPAGAPDH